MLKHRLPFPPSSPFRTDNWRSTDLRVVAVPGLVVEHVEKRFGPAFFVEVVRPGRLRLAEHVAGVHQRCDVLRVAQRRNRRVPGVDRVQHGPLPVRVLVDDGEEYLGQVVTVGVSHVRAQDLVTAIALEAGLKRLKTAGGFENNGHGEKKDLKETGDAFSRRHTTSQGRSLWT